MKISFINKSFALFILLTNIYFVYITFSIIKTEGGTWGYGFLFLPFSLIVNSFIIPALVAFTKGYTNRKFVLVLNSIGTIIIMCLIYLFTDISKSN